MARISNRIITFFTEFGQSYTNLFNESMSILLGYLKSLRDLVYPAACLGCGGSLFRDETILCLGCEMALPVNPYLNQENDPVQKIFSGRLMLHAAYSYLLYSRSGIAQRMIHALKYNDRVDAGSFLGERFALELNRLKILKPEVIVPMPLHPEKQKSRGYNQCHSVAYAMAQVWNCEVAEDAVIRIVANVSQTKLNREKRWDNVKEIFALHQPEKLEDRHVLLLDDTLTTGATLESCGMQLRQLKNVKLSVATLAYAK
jgi:ComF family protein